MGDLENILIEHAKRYPLMEPSDAVKLIYQSVFGGGHMISEPSDVLPRIRDEYMSCKHREGALHTECLGGTARIYLDTELTEGNLGVIARLFMESAKRYPHGYGLAGEAERWLFDSRISKLRQLCREGVFPFGTETLDEYLANYRERGCPSVSHSEVYREAYKPSYRVIDGRYARLLDCIFSIAELLSTGERTVLAIDGRAASGKTTAAELIADIFNASVIHMDDFFLPRELRTAERMAEVGGNIHYERFKDEVIPNLRTGKPFYHKVFDCSHFDFAEEPKKIEPARLIICEGSYSHHPIFGKYYDIAYFSDVDPETQRQRIKERNGEAMLSRFVNEWIPMEERYFASLDKSR